MFSSDQLLSEQPNLVHFLCFFGTFSPSARRNDTPVDDSHLSDKNRLSIHFLSKLIDSLKHVTVRKNLSLHSWVMQVRGLAKSSSFAWRI